MHTLKNVSLGCRFSIISSVKLNNKHDNHYKSTNTANLLMVEIIPTTALSSCGYCDCSTGCVIVTRASTMLSVPLICSVTDKLLNDSVRLVI